MPTYKELLKQRLALDQRIAGIRQRERAAAIVQARTLILEYDLTPLQIFGRNGVAQTHVPAAKPGMYLDPKSGRTWDGAGPPPLWLGTMKRIY